MVELSDVMREGGVFVWLTLLVGLVGLLVAVSVPLVIGFLKWRLPASISWFGLVMVLCSGLAGTALGMSQTMNAVAYASPEMQGTLRAAGASISLYTTVAALWMMVPLAVFACLAGTLPAIVAVGPEPRFDIRGLATAAGAALLTGFGVVIAIAVLLGVSGLRDVGSGLWLPVIVAPVVTAASVITCARVASEDHLHQGRIAGSRFFVGMTGALALVLVGELLRANGLTMGTYALAVASPDHRPMLMAAGQALAANGAALGWLLACIPAVAAASGAMHFVRRVDWRAGVGAAVMGVAAALILGLIYAARAISVAGLMDGL